MLYAASALVAVLGVAHSVLGERYIIRRLLRRDDLPKLFGGAEFTARTIRFAWHVTSVLAIGLAVVLALFAADATQRVIVGVLGVTLLASGVLPLVFTRGRHLSWVVFFAAGGLTLAWVLAG